MGKPKSNNSHSKAPPRNKPASNKAPKYVAPASSSESEPESDEDENFMSFNKKGQSDSEDDAIYKDSDESEDDEDSEDESELSDVEEDEDDDELDSSDEEGRNLKNLVDNLPANIRNKVIYNKNLEDESEDEEEEEAEASWGKKKSAYYNGDTADLEIGQEFDDALEEEEIVKDLYKGKISKVKKSDYYDDLSDEEDEDEEDEDKKAKDDSTIKFTKKSKESAIIKELESLSNGNEEDNQESFLMNTLTSMTQEEKIDLIKKSAPELITLVNELKNNLSTLKQTIVPLKSFIKKIQSLDYDINDDLVNYLELKQQILLTYCLNLFYYLYKKSLGSTSSNTSIKNHPVLKELLRLRYCIEKIQSLDNKLKHQIDRLLKFSVENKDATNEELQSDLLRPNLTSLLNDSDEENDTDDESEEEEKKSKKSKGKKSRDEDDEDLYSINKLNTTYYNEDEKASDKKNKKLLKLKNSLKSSELMASLRDEFSSAPYQESNSGLGTIDDNDDVKKAIEYENDLKKYEEDYFVRKTLTKKDKKLLKNKEKNLLNNLTNFNNLANFNDLDELSKISDFSNEKKQSLSNNVNVNNSFLENSLKELSKKNKFLDMANEFADSDEEDVKHKKKRSRHDDEDINSANIYDDFMEKKKDYKEKKKEHYTKEARYGGYEEEIDLDKDEKRGATYEIIKNRGLTPHRKKENRNPRVKKREKFEKALVARKGQVRDVIKGAADSYNGESTGIKANLARSRKL